MNLAFASHSPVPFNTAQLDTAQLDTARLDTVKARPPSAGRLPKGRWSAHSPSAWPSVPRPVERRATRFKSRPELALTPAAESPALWNGAWVGWLACQTALLILVESTPLGRDAAVAMTLRAAVLGWFVFGFRNACFPTAPGRVAFAVCVVAAEAALAAACNRWSVVTGWPLVIAALAALFAGSPGSNPRLGARASAGLSTSTAAFTFSDVFTLWVLERSYPVLASAARGVAGLAPMRVRRDGSTWRSNLWTRGLNAVERRRQRCALAINQLRSASMAAPKRH